MSSVTEACRRVPLTSSTYIATDYASALPDTVIDCQKRLTTVRRAIEHFNANRGNEDPHRP